MQELATWLRNKGFIVTERARMADRTTLKVGGPAALWLDARDGADIRAAIGAAEALGVSWYPVGQGSNLLVRDGGLPCLVVHTGAEMAGVHVAGREVVAQAGARLSQVALTARSAGLSGMEGLAGIPGTVGGAVFMNAGAYGDEMADIVRYVTVMDERGEVHRVDGDEMRFSYRHSLLMEKRLIVLEAGLLLTPGDADGIAARMEACAVERRQKQPLQLPSAGSFFKRPEGAFAGALIEQAGLKGLSVGGAQVSVMHAGFLVNTGGATAADFLELMQRVQEAVFEKSGMHLEPEVNIIGCDSSS